MKDGALQYMYFREVQRPRQTWIWLVVFVPTGVVWYFFLVGLVESLTQGRPLDLGLLVVLLAVGIAFPLVWLYSTLTIEVRAHDLYIRFIPFFVRRKIPYRDIEGHEARTFNPLTEHGGWGIRVTPGKGTAYVMGGNQGIELRLTGGEILMVGPRKPEEFARALDAARQSATP